MSISEAVPATKNPRKWRFTWESNSHVPIIRLYLFHTNTKPSSECTTDLKVTILSDKSLLQVTWLDTNQQKASSLWVPIPRVLIDVESPISLRALDDHIEVKFVLILPVDHPIVSNFDFEAGDGESALEEDDELQPLQLDSDLKKLASCGKVQFYCKGCSTKLTRAVRNFKEMPSVNWREAADNWFGTCCCSFGGVSEKLVAKYANSYSCAPGMCLVDATSVVLCKDDLLGYKFPDQQHKSLQSTVDNSLIEVLNVDHGSKNERPHDHECGHAHTNEETETEIQRRNELLANKTSLITGLLGNSFMVTSPYLSKEIKWSEISCPQCSCLLGAYPHDNLDGTLTTAAPLNDGVHLFKCFISTCLPVKGSNDLFRKYTLERMFSSQLLESAKDELSFRTVVRNLQTRSPMLQIVMLNPNSWCSFGECMDAIAMVPIQKVNMHPMIKVLFSDCSNSTDSQLRKLDQWVTKNQVEDIYMLMSKALAESLERANRMLPPSHASLQGLSLSFLRR